MKLKAFIFTLAAGVLASSLMPISSGYAATDRTTPEAEKSPPEVGKATQDKARSQVGGAISRQRKEIIDEAVSAIAETNTALQALEQDKPDQALDALARASGKLNIVLAREPALALAPIDINVTLYNVYNSVDAILKARKQAEDYLEAGEVQKARALIDDLASEMVISVVNIPLKTYPDAISAVVPLIDQRKIEKAKAALRAALDTTVISDRVIPLPLLRADVQLARAEALAEKKKRSEEENKNLARLLDAVGKQLKLAEALGYGDQQDYQKLYSELEEIEGKTKLGGAGEGFFDKIKSSLQSIFG
jgi:hypothetical protein